MDRGIILNLIKYLSEAVTENRLKRMREVLGRRTRYVAVVLEDLYQAHNASAVMRTCDGLGIQDVHFLEEKNTMKINDEVALGAEKWLSVWRWNEANGGKEACRDFFKKHGYALVATTPHIKAFTPENIPLDKPLALVFGTEKEGLSDFWLKHADMHLQIPMSGFAESFNISVSAAITLYTIVRRKDFEKHIGLREEESGRLLLNWLISGIREGESMARAFLDKQKFSEADIEEFFKNISQF